MDGFKKRLNDSIQVRLSFALSIAIVVVAIVAGVFSFLSALDEANELQDDMLRELAVLFDRHRLPPATLGDEALPTESDEAPRVIVQYLTGATGESAKTPVDAPLPLSPTLADGLHTLELRGEPFRVLVRTTATGARIALAQNAGIRDEIARESAMRTLVPFLVLVPVLLLMVADLVRKMFRPIATLSREIDARDEQALHPVEHASLPAEVRPFVVAINRLLERVAQSMEAQRRFVADAAHELRTPLAALSLQSARLADADMSPQARERLDTLRRGITRGCHLLDQLLALARAQAAPESPVTSVSVPAVYRRVLEDVMPLAEAKHLDIGISAGEDVDVLATEADLMAVIRNLVDNAVRYTPEGGMVDMSVVLHDRLALLQVRDTGPGIAIEERARVFDPFYRALGNGQMGSGLGLSIVRTITERMGARVSLAFLDEASHTGSCVTVAMPVVQGSRPS